MSKRVDMVVFMVMAFALLLGISSLLFAKWIMLIVCCVGFLVCGAILVDRRHLRRLGS